MTQRRAGAMGLLIGLVLSCTFSIGFGAGALFDRHANGGVETSNSDVRDFLSAYNLVTQQSYYRPFNKHQLIVAAINGMFSATGDPHTVYLQPDQNKAAQTQLNGSRFSGIGAIVVPSGAALQVVAPVPGSPAMTAGIKPGDLILRIDGRSVSGMTGGGAIGRIHGRTGSVVHLTIRRGNGTPFVVSVTRRQISAITAYGRPIAHGLGYVQIFSFGADTARQVASALHALAAAHVRGIVLDLRQNPGGFVDAAQSIVSQFVSGGTVAYEQNRDKSLTPLNVLPHKQIVSVPVAVLVDDGTASAAEITAAALRDNMHARLIGTRTYGKGSMQSVYSLADGSTVRITDRLWLTPHRKSIARVGLLPDQIVQDRTAAGSPGGDPQLAAAERYLEHLAR